MRHVIIGTGPAGVIAAEHIRAADAEAEITLIGQEDESPYSRMAIPYFIEGKIAPEGTHLRHDPEHFRSRNIVVLRGRRVTSVNPGAHEITLEGGETMGYDRLLLATGSSPALPPVQGVDLPGVTPCWTLAQARGLAERLKDDAHVVLVGAGFIGTIIMDAIGSRKLKLTVVESETHMTPRMMSRAGGDLMSAWCAGKGVDVLTETMVSSISQGGRGLQVALNNGTTLDADIVVTATGVRPNIGFLEGSGIETAEGILIDEYMRTSAPDVYAAGDVAQGRDYSRDGKAVHAIQPTAAEHAQVAARNMMGEQQEYRGSLIMNVIAVLGMTVYSFGRWEGGEGCEVAEVADAGKNRYNRLVFEGDYLVGAIHIGAMEQIGVYRGLIQNRYPLGEWKQHLMENPTRIIEAYLGLTDYGLQIPRLSAAVRPTA